MILLEIVKLYLDIEDNHRDPLLTQIITDSTQRILSYIEESLLPVELEWIVRELSIIRFNRIGSEGMTDESEEGRQSTYDKDAFAQFEPFLDRYLEKQKTPVKGKARFL